MNVDLGYTRVLVGVTIPSICQKGYGEMGKGFESYVKKEYFLRRLQILYLLVTFFMLLITLQISKTYHLKSDR